ncbi:acyltransferase [Agaricicola taiwanensis]|uniref:Acyltransferase n=1 Tax=Agaricicola taiwanensis TaxID=591372 RepID=A0A8J2YHZ8_9RHOB|nr:acyltransferase [Agaricicola taiwanensis]GGE43974.1 acyltransferase [Agaricicola taiwanensis]
MAQARIGNLDLLRFCAALAVVFYHLMFRGAAADGYSPLIFAGADVARYGFLGVSCFFVMSGFVIAYSAEGRGLVAFAAARASRLYPAFLVCMTITALAGLVLAQPGSRFAPSLPSYIANLTMLAPAFGQPFMDGAYWSIVLEIMFYGWVALFIALGLFQRRMLILVTGWLAIGLLNEVFLQSGVLRILLVTQYAGHFSIGILLYRLFRRNWTVSAADATVALAAAALLGLGEYNSMRTMEDHFGFEGSIGLTLLVLAVAIAAVVTAVRMPWPILPASLSAALGGISYPLYLLHQHIGYLVFQHLADTIDTWLLLTIAIAALVALSFVIWRFIERPAIPALRSFLMRLGDKALLYATSSIARWRVARP